MTNTVSRDIPLPIQREVRQRCGFGCVVCGLPLYEYDHLDGWANSQVHDANRITLLCDRHHKEKTNDLLPSADLETANQNPWNKRPGVFQPYDLHYSGDSCEVVVGGNVFSTTDAGYGTIMAPLSIDDVPLLGFILGDGHLLLNCVVFSEVNQVVLRVHNNRLVHVPDAWDIELVGRRLVIRSAPRNILIEMVFEVPNRIIVMRDCRSRNCQRCSCPINIAKVRCGLIARQ